MVRMEVIGTAMGDIGEGLEPIGVDMAAIGEGMEFIGGATAGITPIGTAAIIGTTLTNHMATTCMVPIGKGINTSITAWQLAQQAYPTRCINVLLP